MRSKSVAASRERAASTRFLFGGNANGKENTYLGFGRLACWMQNIARLPPRLVLESGYIKHTDAQVAHHT